ncbi:hypothetical protein, partial [Nocardia wallacei]|uniref:preprotein translocase subunit SecA n=1 Tax=Nocardia wallacei TaxID=480035 RepID=UPI0024579F98
MSLVLPPWLPPMVVACAAGRFPLGMEDELRRLGDGWSDRAEECRKKAQFHEDKARKPSEARGETATAIRNKHRQFADRFHKQATYYDSLARGLYEYANTVELMKITVIGILVILFVALLRCALLFAFGGALEAQIQRMAARTAIESAWKKALQFLAGRIAQLAAERGGIVLIGHAMTIGMLQGGGLNVIAQGIQVIEGNREKIDGKAAGVATAAGASGGLVGVLFARWLGPKVGAYAASRESKSARIGVQLAGTAAIGGLGGLGGAAAGTAVSLGLTGEAFTTKAFAEGMLPGMVGGAVIAGGYAARDIRTATPVSVSAGESPRPAAKPEASDAALYDALARNGLTTRDFDPADPAAAQQEINQLVSRVREANQQAGAPRPAPVVNNSRNVQFAGVSKISVDNLSPAKFAESKSGATADPAVSAPKPTKTAPSPDAAAATAADSGAGKRPPDVSPPKQYKPPPERPFSVENNSVDWQPTNMPGVVVDNVNFVKNVPFPAAVAANPLGAPNTGVVQDPTATEAPGPQNVPAAQSDSAGVADAAAPAVGTADGPGPAAGSAEAAAGASKPHPVDNEVGGARQPSPESARDDGAHADTGVKLPAPKSPAEQENPGAAGKPHPDSSDATGGAEHARADAVKSGAAPPLVEEGVGVGQPHAVDGEQPRARPGEQTDGQSPPERRRGVAADAAAGPVARPPEAKPPGAKDEPAQPVPAAAVAEASPAQQRATTGSDTPPAVSELTPAGPREGAGAEAAEQHGGAVMSVASPEAPAAPRTPGQPAGAPDGSGAPARQQPAAQQTGGNAPRTPEPRTGTPADAPAAGGGNRPPAVSAPKVAASERPPAVEPTKTGSGRSEDGVAHKKPTTDGDNIAAEDAKHGRADDDGANQQEVKPHPGHTDEDNGKTSAAAEPDPQHGRADDGASPDPTGAQVQKGDKAERPVSAEQRQNELVWEHHRQRIQEANERVQATHAELKQQEKAVRVAEAHERATRLAPGDELRELFGQGTAEDRVAVEAARAAREQLSRAQENLAECRTAYEDAVAVRNNVASALARDLLAMLPSADPTVRADLTPEQLTQFKTTAKAVQIVYRLRSEEFAGASWTQRRQGVEGGDELESLLWCVDTVREATGLTPRWNQNEAVLLGEHGYMRQMGTGQGKSIVGAMDSLRQLSRGEPVELSDGRSERVHHVITTTETLANEGIRQFAPMFRNLGYEAARWDTHNPPPEPDVPTVYYMTYDERATAQLFDQAPPGKTATIDEADAVLVHNQTVHYQSDGQREVASDVEAAGVYRVRDFLRGALKDRVLTSADLRADPEGSLTKAGQLWEQRTGRAFSAEETEMARALLDVKAGRLKLNREFQIFDGKIQILDEYGKPRSDPKVGTESRWFGGRHKMVEAMFGVDVYSDGKGLKQVTVEDVFGDYQSLKLMSGTLERTAAEIKENFPVEGGLAKVEDFARSKLTGEEDRIFLTGPEKLKDAVAQVLKLQAEGRPVLVISPTNDIARAFSLMLTKAGVEHDAIYGRWFAEHRDNNAAEEHLLSVKDGAGKRGKVTVGTGMLGRGFDVSITDEVNALGGVHAQMLGRSARNPDEDHQWAARAGRNGRNGSYCFNVAVTDRLYTDAASPQAQVAVAHYRSAVSNHAEAAADMAGAAARAPEGARPAPAVGEAAQAKAAAETNLKAAENLIRQVTPELQQQAADLAYVERSMRRANPANAPPGDSTGQTQQSAPPAARTAAPHATPQPQHAQATVDGVAVPTAAGLAAGSAATLASGNPPTAPNLRDEHGDNIIRQLLELLNAPGGQAAAPLLPVAQAVQRAVFDEVEAQGIPIGTDVTDHLRTTARNLLDTSLDQLDPAQRQTVTEAGTALQQRHRLADEEGRALTESITQAIKQLVGQVPHAQLILAAAPISTVPFDQWSADDRTRTLQQAQQGDRSAVQALDRHFGPAIAQSLCTVLWGGGGGGGPPPPRPRGGPPHPPPPPPPPPPP